MVRPPPTVDRRPGRGIRREGILVGPGGLGRAEAEVSGGSEEEKVDHLRLTVLERTPVSKIMVYTSCSFRSEHEQVAHG